MYSVELSVRAWDFLIKLDKNTKERVEKRLKNSKRFCCAKCEERRER